MAICNAPYPQVWKSGAEISMRSRARSGIRSRIEHSGPKAPGVGRPAPRGVRGPPDRAPVAFRAAQLAGLAARGEAVESDLVDPRHAPGKGGHDRPELRVV